MKFLLDENVPNGLAAVFTERGWTVQPVNQLSELRGQPDEIIFNFATGNLVVFEPGALRIHEL